MKNRKAIFWILFMTAVTLALHAFLSYKGGVATQLVQRTALVDKPQEQPWNIIVQTRGAKPTIIERQGADWRLVSPYGAIADERAVMRLLDLLAVSVIEDTLGDQELLKLGRTRKDFGLDDPEVRVTLNGGEPSCEISFGYATPSGGGVYTAIGDDKAVYVVSSNVFAAANLPADGFRKRNAFPEMDSSVSSFDLKRGAGSFLRFTRYGDAWQMREPSQATANAAKVRELLAAATECTAVDFVWPVGAQGESETATASLLAGYGLDPESAVTLTIRRSDGADSQVSFGKEAKGGLVYALIHDACAIATVDSKIKDLALAGERDFTDSRLFPSDQRAITRVAVTAEGTNYLLAKNESGQWMLDAPVVAATDEKSVAAFLDRLFALEARDLDPNGITVSAVTSSPPVSVSRKALLGDMRLEDLRSRDIVNIDPASVRRLVATPYATRPTAVVYDRDRRAWNIEASPVVGTVSTEAVEAILAALNPLAAETVVKLKVSAADLREFGLETPALSVAVDLDREDAIRRNLLIGRKTDKGGYYATLGATDAVFVISNKTADALSASLVSADRDRAAQSTASDTPGKQTK